MVGGVSPRPAGAGLERLAVDNAGQERLVQRGRLRARTDRPHLGPVSHGPRPRDRTGPRDDSRAADGGISARRRRIVPAKDPSDCRDSSLLADESPADPARGAWACARATADRVRCGSDKRSHDRQLRVDPAQLFGRSRSFCFSRPHRNCERRCSGCSRTSPESTFSAVSAIVWDAAESRSRSPTGRGPDRVREELLFDPATSNLLQTEMVQLHNRRRSRGPSVPAGTVVKYTDFLSRGVVNSITQLPDGRHLPLRPAGDSR